MTFLSLGSQGVFLVIFFLIGFIPPKRYEALLDMAKTKTKSEDCREYFKKSYNWPVLIISKRLAGLWYAALFMSLTLWAREADNFDDVKIDENIVVELHKYTPDVHMAVIFLPILFAILVHFLSFKMTEKSTDGVSTQQMKKLDGSNKRSGETDFSKQGQWENMSPGSSILKSLSLSLLVIGCFIIEMTLMGGANQSHRKDSITDPCTEENPDGSDVPVPVPCKDHSSTWMWVGVGALLIGFLMIIAHAVYKYGKLQSLKRTKGGDQYSVSMMGSYYIGLSLSEVVGFFILAIINIWLYAYYFQHDTKWANSRYFLAYINFIVPLYMLYVFYKTWSCQSIGAKVYNFALWILIILTIVFFPLMMRKDTLGTKHDDQQTFNLMFYLSALLTLFCLILGTKMSDNNLIPLMSFKCFNGECSLNTQTDGLSTTMVLYEQ